MATPQLFADVKNLLKDVDRALISGSSRRGAITLEGVVLNAVEVESSRRGYGRYHAYGRYGGYGNYSTYS